MIDASADRVTEQSVNALFQRRQRAFALSSFAKVVSYVEAITRGPYYERVELVTQAGGEALLIARFLRDDNLGLSAASADAEALRIRIAHAFAVEEGGFLGRRWVGVQL